MKLWLHWAEKEKNKRIKIKKETKLWLRWEGGFRGEHQGERRPRNHDDAPEGEKDILKEREDSWCAIVHLQDFKKGGLVFETWGRRKRAWCLRL